MFTNYTKIPTLRKKSHEMAISFSLYSECCGFHYIPSAHTQLSKHNTMFANYYNIKITTFEKLNKYDGAMVEKDRELLALHVCGFWCFSIAIERKEDLHEELIHQNKIIIIIFLLDCIKL